MKHTQLAKLERADGARGVVMIASDEPELLAIAKVTADCLSEFANDIRDTGGAWPGDDPAVDGRAWDRLTASDRTPGEFILMWHTKTGSAAFKNRYTGRYTYIVTRETA